MVGGDGTAPALTHVMLSLIDVPASFFGWGQKSALLLASVFWGALVAVCTFALLQVIQALR
jgi:hypothetical protein